MGCTTTGNLDVTRCVRRTVRRTCVVGAYRGVFLVYRGGRTVPEDDYAPGRRPERRIDYRHVARKPRVSRFPVGTPLSPTAPRPPSSTLPVLTGRRRP